jgi:hypothetical protein
MTYNEYYKKLQDNLAEKGKIYLEMEKKVCQIKGFGSVEDYVYFMQAKQELDIAYNDYNSFIAHQKGKNINPNDDIDINLLFQ